jgi:hypothetical protein
MSRSHRKPIRTQFQDAPGIKKVSKRMANKAVRRASKAEIENQEIDEIIARIENAEQNFDKLPHIPLKKGVGGGSMFKRIFNSWNICDWKSWDHDGKDKRSGRK